MRECLIPPNPRVVLIPPDCRPAVLPNRSRPPFCLALEAPEAEDPGTLRGWRSWPKRFVLPYADQRHLALSS